MRVVAAAFVALFLTASCGGSDGGPEPAGPNVRGFALPDARAALSNAGVKPVVRLVKSQHDLPATANPADYLVCHVNYIGRRAVELLVNRGSCPS
jgi:hypothetical protein